MEGCASDCTVHRLPHTKDKLSYGRKDRHIVAAPAALSLTLSGNFHGCATSRVPQWRLPLV
uniref:Uncharacterized protein n=1 Tax=Anguilla anguilla TaxID=7936 RepID=A0A0E9PXK4_ANGAN